MEQLTTLLKTVRDRDNNPRGMYEQFGSILKKLRGLLEMESTSLGTLEGNRFMVYLHTQPRPVYFVKLTQWN